MDKPLIVPFFIPHAGCPFTCAFCNQWEISGAEHIARPEEIEPKVRTYLAARKKKPLYCEVAFYGGSFTGLSGELQNSLLQAAFELKVKGLIQGIRLSTRPDYINEQICANLAAYGVTAVEIGVQSLADEVLTASCRGHTVADVISARQIIKNYPFELIFQLMLGLPGDSPERALATACKTIELKPDGVRIYPTLVMKGTALAKWYEQGQYKPWSLDEAVEMGFKWLALFEAADIKVIRIGLQAADNLSLEADLLAGPYHPAYGELVQSRLMLEQMRVLLNGVDCRGKPLIIYCNFRDHSKVAGQRGRNVKLLFQDYGCQEITIKTSASLTIGDLQITAGQETKQLTRQEFLIKHRNIIK